MIMQTVFFYYNIFNSVYDDIAEFYSEIFPLEDNRIKFIENMCLNKKKILDIGCATGDLSINLARLGYNVVGIDLNQKMINIASEKKNLLGLSVKFICQNMQSLDYSSNFDAVLCFGNTLPHLDDLNALNIFIKHIRKILSPGGVFIFQILNYDKILAEKEIIFPVIETEKIHFERNYSTISKDLIQFDIQLIVKPLGLMKKNSVFLFPIVKDEMCNILTDNGFKNIQIYQDYYKTPSDLSEYASIYVVKVL